MMDDDHHDHCATRWRTTTGERVPAADCPTCRAYRLVADSEIYERRDAPWLAHLLAPPTWTADGERTAAEVADAIDTLLVEVADAV